MVNVWLWLGAKDYSTIASENAKHLAKAYEIYLGLNQPGSILALLNTFTYPPLFYLSSVALFALAGGCNESLAILSTLPYFAITMASLYKLCRFAAGRYESLYAALMIGALMTNSIQIDGYIIEYGLLAWVTLSIYLFIRSNYFTNLPYTIALALCASCGLLTKWTYPAYMAFPVLLAIYQLLKPSLSRDTKRSILRGLAYLVLICAALASPWYFARHNHGPNYLELVNHFSSSRSSELSDFVAAPEAADYRQQLPPILQAAPVALLVYLGTNIFPPHLSLSILIGLGWCLGIWCKRENSSHFLFLIVMTILVPLVFFSFYPSQQAFLPEKTLRHLAPLTALGLIPAVFWLVKLGRHKWLVLTPYVIISLVSLLGWCIPYQNIYKNSVLLRPVSFPIVKYYASDPLGIIAEPRKQDIEVLADKLAAYCRQGKQPIFVFAKQQDFQPIFVELYARLGPGQTTRLNNDKTLTSINIMRQTEDGPVTADSLTRPLKVTQRSSAIDGDMPLSRAALISLMLPRYQKISSQQETFRVYHSASLDTYIIAQDRLAKKP